MNTDLAAAHRVLDVSIEGMTCGSCAARVQKVLGKQEGVFEADVNYATGRARLDIDETADVGALRTAVERAGYTLVAPEMAPFDSPGATADARRDFDVEGMTCGSCAARVQKVLQRQDGVETAEVNYATGRASITVVPGSELDPNALSAAVERAGYELRDVSPVGAVTQGPSAAERAEQADADDAAEQTQWLRRALISAPIAAFMVSTMLYHDAAMEREWLRWLQFALAVPVQFYVGWPPNMTVSRNIMMTAFARLVLQN